MPAPATTAWATLLPAALAGTRRQPLAPLPGLTPPLGGEADAPEKQLLLTAASLTLVQRAGARPAGNPAHDLGRAPVETTAALGPVGTGQLLAILDDPALARTHHGLQEEFGQLGGRLPPRLLGEAARRLPAVEFAEYLHNRFRAFGQRGRWLEDAKYSSHPYHRARQLARPVTAGWWQVEKQQRAPNLQLLSEQRPPDGWPWLLAELQRANATQQKELLSVLVGWCRTEALPPEFEPVLAKVVHQWWAGSLVQVLVQLPGNALLERHWARLQPLLAYEPATHRLTVTLPTWDDAWSRDHLIADAATAPPAQAGGRGLLRRLLSWVPPRRWLAAWHLSAPEAVALAAESEHAATVLTGWLEAAVLHQDAAFGKVLMEYFINHWPVLEAVYENSAGYRLQRIFSLLPPPEQLAWLHRQLLAAETAPAAWLKELAYLLRKETGAYLPALLESTLLPLLRATLATPTRPVPDPLTTLLLDALYDLALGVPPSLWSRLKAELTPLAQGPPAHIRTSRAQEILRVLQVRAQLAGLLASGA